MTTRITNQKVEKDFIKLKGYAQKCYLRKDYLKAFNAIKTASKLMYTYNILYQDDDMERILVDIASAVLNRDFSRTIKSSDKRIVFYDYFALDNRGLTEQYINSLIDLKYKFLFITYKKENLNKSKKVFEKLDNYKDAQIYEISSKNNIEQSKELYQAVINFGATKALIHTSPWDVVGISTFSYLKEIERYLINLTDHAFWLGKCCLDYVIEFRTYGYNISKNYRNIPKEKLVLLPYYPIQDCDTDFEGFPFDYQDKKIVFSGGAIYKIYGSDIFFNIIKYIIEKYKDVVFLYVGGGESKPFLEFIEKNNFEKRVFLLNDRKDINEIFKRCYFYLGTYPISGGLMTQLAIANKKIPIAYTNPELKINFIEPLFINTDNKKFTYTNLDDLYLNIDRLISDSEYKKKLEEKLENLIITPKEFTENLFNVITSKSTRFLLEDYEININSLSEIYLQMENNYLHHYNLIFIRSRNIKIILKFFSIGLLKKLISIILIKFKNKFIERKG